MPFSWTQLSQTHHRTAAHTTINAVEGYSRSPALSYSHHVTSPPISGLS